MDKPHYIVRRSRSGRFNFVLITEAGRFTGSVSIRSEGQSSAEIKRQASDKIRALAKSFAEATRGTLMTEDGPMNEAEADEPPPPPSAHLLHKPYVISRNYVA
ncbi:hypothetical protein FV230_03040 [Methylobacterium sp. WL6]|nr:hypothetical protein FV230_03040 [Methylobacterium sp. WL6]